MQNSFSYLSRVEGFALRLVLKQRHKRTQKWPIEELVPIGDAAVWLVAVIKRRWI